MQQIKHKLHFQASMQYFEAIVAFEALTIIVFIKEISLLLNLFIKIWLLFMVKTLQEAIFQV